jgi:hypothetical protein
LGPDELIDTNPSLSSNERLSSISSNERLSSIIPEKFEQFF